MRKPSRREWVLGVVLVGAVMYTVSLDQGLKSKRQKNRSMRDDARKQLRAPAPAGGGVSGGMVRASGGRRPVIRAGAGMTAWGLDPFDRPFAMKHEPIVESRIPGYDGELHLNGIMTGVHGRVAMINGDLYRRGDRIEGYVLERIGNGVVVLRHSSDGSTTRIKVE